MGISDRSVVISEIVHAESSERTGRFQSVLRASFAFSWSAREVRVKWPVYTRTLGYPCLTNAKSFASPQLVWTGVANLQFGERTTEPEINRCEPTRVRANA